MEAGKSMPKESVVAWGASYKDPQEMKWEKSAVSRL